MANMIAPNISTNPTGDKVSVRDIDFVTQFQRNFEALTQILGIVRPIKKASGSRLVAKTAVVSLDTNQVGEGEQIKASTVQFDVKDFGSITVEKFKTSIPIERISEYGYEVAVAMTDEEFRYELTDNVTGRFYTFLQTGTLVGMQKTWQAALAIARGGVINKWKKMGRTMTGIVGFANVMDAHKYLAEAGITTQTLNGIEYVKNFLGYETLILLSDDELPQKKVIAVPKNNLVAYFVDPADSDFARAGLVYTKAGETNLIGYHSQGNYDTATSDSYALMGLRLFAEYLDGICVVTVDSSKTATDPAVAPSA